MTDTTKFLPGDRVIAKPHASNGLTGWLGTVVEPREDIKECVCVRFDNDVLSGERHVSGRDYRYWYKSDTHHYIERAPIKVGDTVRIHNDADHSPNAFNADFIGKTFVVEEIDDIFSYYHDETGMRCTWSLDYLAPVTSTNSTLFAANPMFDLLRAKLNKLALAIYANHYGEQPFSLSPDPFTVIDQIDNMTAGLKRTDPAITEAASIFAEWLAISGPGKGGKTRAWLAKYSPETLPTFKRGDYVAWGLLKGYIIGPAPTKNAPWEVLITECGDAVIIGQFTTPHLSDLRHVVR